MSTGSLLQIDWVRVQRQPMVDKRDFPAESPAAFDSFTTWIRSATRVHSYQQRLADYLGVNPQNITKWRKGSIPDSPAIRKAIAEWAHVDYNELRDLIDKTAEIARVPKGQRAKGIARSRTRGF